VEALVWRAEVARQERSSARIRIAVTWRCPQQICVVPARTDRKRHVTIPVHEVTIIPNSRKALGYTMQMPTEDQ
jgi:hypothetical protein